MQTSAQLSKYLLSPQRFVNNIRWKPDSQGKLMALSIASKQVSIAITSLHSQTITYSSSIEQKKNNYQQLVDEIKSISKTDNIDGFVINWPLEKSGQLGKACGKVCHVLDIFVQNNIISHNTPFTLWNHNESSKYDKHGHNTHRQKDELYNRSMSFSHVPSLSHQDGFKSISIGNLNLWEYSTNRDDELKQRTAINATAILQNFIGYSCYNDIINNYQEIVDDEFDDEFDDINGKLLAHA